MNWSIEHKTRLTFSLVILLVILIGFLSYRSTINFISANESVLHTRQILDVLHTTLTSALDVEIVQLDYLATEDTTYIDQYHAVKGLVVPHLADLRTLTADEPTQQSRLVSLDSITATWLSVVDQVVMTQQTGGIEQARQLLTSGQASALSAQMRTILDTMTNDEETLLAQNRLTQAAQRDQYTLITFAVLTLVMVGLLLLGYRRIYHDLRARRKIEQQLEEERTLLRTVIDTLPDYIYVKDANSRLVLANRAHAELVGAKSVADVIGKSDAELFPLAFVPQYMADEKAIFQSGKPLVDREEPTASSTGEQKIVLTTKVPVRNAAGEITQIAGISHDITARKLAEQEIGLLNESLRRETAKLETANKELEAFSYSVSHDLRAPLRAIDGFSRILMDEYGTKLDAEALRYLDKVRNNARHMGELIDDLLRFSRLSRQAMSKQKIRPSELVQQIVNNELRDEHANRPVELIIGDMPECEADPTLLRQVYVNLLSNALKFTSKCEAARIEVGATRENGEVIYFVRDNGAGFDQQYVHKLFGVFQRLHRIEDYSGTGVGLAIVQRVIIRHGGRVWAEGVVNQGASFYFTLGANHVN